MKRSGLCIAALVALSLSLSAGAASAQSTAGLDKLYILNCGEGVAGDISRWSPGVNVGKPMLFVDNCYLIHHAQGWLLWDTGVADAIAAMPEGQAPHDPRMTHWRRPKTLAGAARGDRRQARRHQVCRGLAHASGPHRQCRAVPAVDAAGAEGRIRMADAARRRRFKPEHPVTKLEGDHDVFGDGSVTILATPGHTPGHQSLLVQLPKTGALVLSGDAVHFKSNWDNRGVPVEQHRQGQDARLDAAHRRRSGEGKGAALDQSRQGPARQPDHGPGVLRVRETSSAARQPHRLGAASAGRRGELQGRR